MAAWLSVNLLVIHAHMPVSLLWVASISALGFTLCAMIRYNMLSNEAARGWLR